MNLTKEKWALETHVGVIVSKSGLSALCTTQPISCPSGSAQIQIRPLHSVNWPILQLMSYNEVIHFGPKKKKVFILLTQIY